LPPIASASRLVAAKFIATVILIYIDNTKPKKRCKMQRPWRGTVVLPD